MTQAAGANSENKLGGLSLDGASPGEDRYIVDGAERTNLQSGTQGRAEVMSDFIEEVQVKSSDFTAEYGGATGGVISAITKSGTNSFHGAANLFYQSDSLHSDYRPTLRLVPTNSQAAEYITYREDDYNRWEPGFQLSGPIVKDKMWFFAGYQPVFRPLDRTRPLNDGVVRTFTRFPGVRLKPLIHPSADGKARSLADGAQRMRLQHLECNELESPFVG